MVKVTDTESIGFNGIFIRRGNTLDVPTRGWSFELSLNVFRCDIKNVADGLFVSIGVTKLLFRKVLSLVW